MWMIVTADALPSCAYLKLNTLFHFYVYFASVSFAVSLSFDILSDAFITSLFPFVIG